MQHDTIYALSTPPGKSGVAVLRASGPQCQSLLLQLTKRQTLPEPRRAILSSLYAQNGSIIDRALVLFFTAPSSFTGEDMLELHVHGSAAIIAALTDELSRHSHVRSAEPGEFMRRAFFNEKVDLLEAEAIADMIDAETTAQLAQAVRQMQGHHSEYFNALRQSIVEILALLEAYIDFPEEDIPQHVLSEVADSAAALREQIKVSLDDNNIGERVRSGFRVSIVGAPNVGKSTLLNALAKRQAAIVSPQAGTTRDVIEISMDIAGYPVTLCDTAGMRDSGDEIEMLGIERSHQSLAQSDIALLIIDGTCGADHVRAMGPLLKNHEEKSVLLIINKCDEATDADILTIYELMQCSYAAIPVVAISAKSGNNLTLLENEIKGALDSMMPAENTWITRARHRELLANALGHLSEEKIHLPLELYCEEIRLAALNIGKITGQIIADELLEVIFSRFCIGK